MNKHQAALFSFLSRAASGEAEMPPHVLDEFGELAKQALKKQFSKREEGFRLRMSNVGRPLCQLQMEAANTEVEAPDYDFKMRMIIGDVLEAVIIALLKGAGETLLPISPSDIQLGEQAFGALGSQMQEMMESPSPEYPEGQTIQQQMQGLLGMGGGFNFNF